ncbi:MAG: DUF3379 family protein [Acidiferrobacterales bacterium]
MNCLEFRRRSLAEPGCQESKFLRHKRNCTRCAEFSLGVMQFDKGLTEALQVEVPNNLASRIILRQSLDADRAQRTRKRRLYAWAASVLLTLGLAGGWFTATHVPPVDRSVIARISEVPASQVAAEQVSYDRLVRVLRTLGGELSGSLGQVSYASIYYMQGLPCGQLVLAGMKGPVNVLLMPGVYVDNRRALRSKQWNGVIVPTANGSMAIVGEQGEALDDVEQQVRSAVIWRL